ncbi:hypothetical protein B0T18DRAFT_110 [Schizothecium vesticola]|uniref:Uncharacterized protein n=1 Tax=Schizothecium vesticola TaxID=314040 RepID=A0AA40F7M1_9PEZI|nr:hypothetical protein B0T18DRAFT_110 [Schizothecium vesticola]
MGKTYCLHAFQELMPEETLSHPLRDNSLESRAKWFGMLCEAYGRTGAEPLTLQALHCKPGGTFLETPSFYKINDLQYLEDVQFGSGNPNERFSAVMNDAPSLRRFSSWMCLPEMHVELSRTMDPIRMLKIAIFFQKEGFQSRGGFHALALPAGSFHAIPLQPRMIHIDLDQNNARGNWIFDPAFSSLSADQVLDLLVSGPGREMLEGLLVYLPSSEKLALSTIAVEAVQGVLPSLLNLTQLRVIATRELDADLELDSSEFQQQRMHITKLTFKLAKASRHLRYISVDCYRWGIISHDDLEMT